MNVTINLSGILRHQSELMAQFRGIEKKNGFHFPTPPVDPDGFANQAELRRLAWCIQEELCEAADAMSLPEWRSAVQKELIDALHFIAEFLLTLGYWPDDLPPEDSRSPDVSLNGPTPNLFNTMIDLGMVVNSLKNKPWKQTDRPTDIVVFRRKLARFVRGFIRTCYSLGMSDNDIHLVYFGKAAENQNRIDTGV